jgi:methyl-accepting chemotaxis protein
MKLESKLGLSTGFLIVAMLLSAYTAHVRIEEANHLSDVVTTSRLPIIMGSRDVDSHLTRTISGLESYILFGLDPASSASFRQSRKQQFDMAEAAVEKLRQDSMHFDLGADAARLSQLESGLATLKPLEEKVETLNESKTSQGTAQAYDTLQNQIVPLEKSLFSTITDMDQSQMMQTNEELVQLRRANRATLYTLWLATILGAIIGGFISVLLARRITKAIDLVAERANAIAAGDLTGSTLRLAQQ